MAKHHSKPHGDIHAMAVSANKVLIQYQKKLDNQTEEIRKDYEKQLIDKANDDWLRNLATSIQVFYEMTGSKIKSEKFAEKLNDKLREYRERQTTTQEIVEEVERLTDLCLSVEG